MRKKLGGTVATFVDFTPGENKSVIHPLKVLSTYVSCHGVPLHWTQARLAELSSAISWALENLDPEVIDNQHHFESE